MANGVDGHIFDYVKTTSRSFARIINTLANGKSYVVPGYDQEFAGTASGLEITIAPGWAVIQGRVVTIKEAVKLTVAANWTGYLALEIDLSKGNTGESDPGSEDYTWSNNQVDIVLVEELVSGNLADTDTLTHFPLYTVTATASTATLKAVSESYVTDKNLMIYNAPDASSTMYPRETNVFNLGNPDEIKSINILWRMYNSDTNPTTFYGYSSLTVIPYQTIRNFGSLILDQVLTYAIYDNGKISEVIIKQVELYIENDILKLRGTKRNAVGKQKWYGLQRIMVETK